MSKEPKVRADFYRALTNCISSWITPIYGERIKRTKITRVAIEHPVNSKKADLVVFRQFREGEADYPLLVIETKGRRISPAAPLARASTQAMNYAKHLKCNFFAVYDGWNFLLFEMKYPYLIKLSKFLRVNTYLARDILSGLLQFEKYKHEAESLKKLPKVPDGWSFRQTIMLSIAKLIASVTNPNLKDYWKTLHRKWLPIIQRDGEW